MKNSLLLLATAISIDFAHGAAVTITNYDEASGRQRPISTSGGSAILTGGVVVIGSWANDPTPLFDQLKVFPSPVVWAEIVSNFISFGAPTSIGSSFNGLYESVAQAPISQGGALDGKTVYTLMGNGATLSASTDVALITDGSTFAFDNPLFSGRADISAPNAQVLFGNATGPSVETALGSAPSLMLGGPIPEPLSMTLMLSGLIFIIRRRRAG